MAGGTPRDLAAAANGGRGGMKHSPPEAGEVPAAFRPPPLGLGLRHGSSAVSGGGDASTSSAALQAEFPWLWAAGEAPSLAQLQQLEARVDASEQHCGKHYPPVGKAWMTISRMYHSAPGGAAGAARAVARAQECLQACRDQLRSSAGSGCSSNTSCDDSFEYLLGRVRPDSPRYEPMEVA